MLPGVVSIVAFNAAYVIAGGLMWYWVLRELRNCEQELPASGKASAKTRSPADAIIGGHPCQHEVLPAR